MRLLVLLRFIPNQPWRPSSWRAVRRYVTFRLDTMYGNYRPPKRVLIADMWRFLGWAWRAPRAK